MILSVMRHCNNFFVAETKTGNYEIVNNELLLDDSYLVGQYIIITKSVLNNGLHEIKENHKVENLKDEKFNGIIHKLAIPLDFMDLCKEIDDFYKRIAELSYSGYMSEKFGDYTYTFNNDVFKDWRIKYKIELNRYRKMFSEVDI
jgi:hypothetical protein